MKFLALITATALLVGCSSEPVRMIGEAKTYSSGSCSVTIYQTRDEAVANGMTKELCVVRGSSAYSFDHTIEGAIKKNFEKICACGANKAFITAAHTQPDFLINRVAHVNLVGFK